MTPKEKAKELVYKFDDTMEFSTPQRFAKQCALISVDEIAKCTKYENKKFDNDRFSEDYWKEVKQEIEKL
jgi:predicted patatin/cPLA2 family phospholipase